jgi:cytochrome c biogenesis protein CcdA
MFHNFIKNYKKKSLKERFLLFIGILFLFSYFVLGIMIMFYKSIPLNISQNSRYALGILLIVYSFIRFLRMYKANSE